jgi:Holliday junction DNA helicase RuvA
LITYIKGTIVEKNPAFVVLENNGIGYLMQISVHTYEALPEKGNCSLYCHVYFREDGQSMLPIIYGFAEPREKEMFLLLISVSGVGANTARMMLSSMNVDDLAAAIYSDNDGVIQKIKGVGPKTAKKIVIELKDKLGKTATSAGKTFVSESNTIKNEALSALAVLGINPKGAEKAIQTALKENNTIHSVEELVKAALKKL